MEPDAAAIRASVRDRFAAVARDPATERRFPLGRASALALGYGAADLDALPAASVARFAGVGDPLAPSMGGVAAGEGVLDLGCGSGVDLLRASRVRGVRALGIDMTPGMLAAARSAGARVAAGALEALPVRDGWADLVITNGVLNLCPDKERVLAEAFRALRPGGRLRAADVVLDDGVDRATAARLGAWSD